MRGRRLLSNAAEEQLKRELTYLWNCCNPMYTVKQIAHILKVGQAGTIYESLTEQSIWYYHSKFSLHRGISRSKKAQKLKQCMRVLKSAVKYDLAKEKFDIVALAKKWEEFDGTWTEFARAERVLGHSSPPKTPNIVDELEMEMHQ
jgi:hypothetical protein